MLRAGFAIAAAMAIGAGARAQDSAYNHAVLDDGPLFYWTFDEPGDRDDAIDAVHPAAVEDRLVAQGNATRIDHAALGDDPFLGRTADFDGSFAARFYAADVGGAPGGPGFEYLPTGLWVLEMWFQKTGDPMGTRGQYLMEGIGAGASNNPGIIVDFTGPNYFELFGGGGRTGTAGPQVQDNEWHHLVVACYGNSAKGVADRWDIVLDGDAFTGLAGNINLPFALREIGVGNTVAGGGVDPFQGNIDELAVYDLGGRLAGAGFDVTAHNPDAETAMADIVTAIAAHRDAATAPGYKDAVLADEPLLYWTFDEAGDEDPAANQAPGALPEDTLVAQGNTTRVSHADLGDGLELGRAASFDGAAGTRFYAADLRGSGPGIDLVPSQLWALEMWFKIKPPTTGFRGDYLLESVPPGGSNSPGLIYDYNFGGGEDYIEMFTGGRTGASGPQVSDDLWHHIVFAFYGNNGGFGVADRRDIVLDGKSYTDRTSSFSTGFALVQLFLGCTGNGTGGFEGYIDEVALYDVGSKLAAQGIPLSPQTPEGEDAFEAFVQKLADHRLLVPGSCQEDADSVSIDGPADGVIGPPVVLTATFAGADPGGKVTCEWSVRSGDAAIVDRGDGTAEVTAAATGQVVVEVTADDGVCAAPGSGVKATHSICFETADDLSLDAPATARVGEAVALRAGLDGVDPLRYIDRTSGFSSGFALSQYAVGNTVAGGGVNGFEGRIDEMAVYDIGTQLSQEGIDISVQNPAAEAAFEDKVLAIAGHALQATQDGYGDAILATGPLLYWSFDEDGDLDPAANLAADAVPEDDLAPQGGATRVNHDDIGSGLLLGRAAQFDGADGSRFFAGDLKGIALDVVPSQLWAIEFWFQIQGANDGFRGDYFVEGWGPSGSNDPGLIYDFDYGGGDQDRLEMFRGARTGGIGPQVSDGNWHHVVMAFFGNSGGFGVADRREIVIDGGVSVHWSWSVLSGDAELVDHGDGTATLTPKAAGPVTVMVAAGDGVCADPATAERTIQVSGGALPAPRNVVATAGNKKVDLRWDAVAGAQGYDVYRDGAKVNADPILAAAFTDAPLANRTSYCYEVTALGAGGGSARSEKVCATPFAAFLRGDADGNGAIELTDAITTLSYMFLGGAPPSCFDAADTDDNGAIELTDAITTLSYMFLGGAKPPAPGVDACGPEPEAVPPHFADKPPCEYTCPAGN